MITRYTLIFDNLMHGLRIVCNQRIGEDPEADYVDAIRGIEKHRGGLSRADSDRDAPRRPPIIGPLVSNMDLAAYSRRVNRAKTFIEEGEAIQVVPSRSFTADFDGSPFEIYRALRSINPSPYMFYLDFGDFVLLGASPEVMVRVEDGKAILRPIAGTRPRGKTRRRTPPFGPSSSPTRRRGPSTSCSSTSRATTWGASPRRLRLGGPHDGGRVLLARDAHRLRGLLQARAGRRHLRRHTRDLPRGHGLGRAQDQGHGDHRRAREASGAAPTPASSATSAIAAASIPASPYARPS
jgi:hypothetical protein